jgi:signal transduction histidine kinase/Pyruvate/2-oxoacid:ferredoxin oxidoreductase delta subunit
MGRPNNIQLVKTIKERCRVCYTCVRECPAKAIRIADGQAEVIAERCIGCGNCVRVCSQHAKDVFSEIEKVRELLAQSEIRNPKSDIKVAACLAPSFPAEFLQCDHRHVVGMLRGLGFDFVNEVSFGADLVARRYRELLAGREAPADPAEPNCQGSAQPKGYIATTCPAIVSFVERYYPDLVGSLCPVVSPMVATARVLRQIHGNDVRVVFIGPCIAKKGEAASELLEGEVDAALTFVELRQMLQESGLSPQNIKPGEFDQPHGCMGALFPVSRGMLQAAGISEDLVAGKVLAAEGKSSFVDAIKEFQDGQLDASLLEVLCCNGCIMGAGISCDTPMFSRRARVSQYMRRRLEDIDKAAWQTNMERFTTLDLSRSFAAMDQRILVPFEEELALILARMGKQKPEDELNCGACGYDTCREHAVAIFKGLAESEMCLPYTIEQLRQTVKKLELSSTALASAQEALMQSEKLASMGQLAAGIAHEVNNPLGVVLMYAHLLLEQSQESSAQHEDLSMIAQQADRCKTIVQGLLHFARQNKLSLQTCDANEIVEDALRGVALPQNVQVDTTQRAAEPIAELDRDQTIQVLTNLITNAVAAMPEGGKLTVVTAGDDQAVQFTVSDTGIGIPRENLGKIFEPFFTTKQMGKGTGLGLAITYGIVKMHRGDIAVSSNANSAAGATGTTFTVKLPRQAKTEEPISATGTESI